MSKITRIPFGDKISVEDVQLERIVPRDYLVVDSLKNAFEIVKAKPAETVASMFLVGMGYMVVYFFVYLVMFAAAFAGVAVGELLKDVNEILAQVVIFGVIGVVYIFVMGAMIIAQTVAFGAYTICILKVVRGQEVNIVEDIKSVKRFIKPLVITSLLFSLAVMVGMFGFVIGAYVVMFGCMFAQVLVIDKNISGIDALKASWRITDGHKLNLLGFFFVAQLLNMAGMMACGVGMILTMAMTMVGLMTIYDALVEPGDAYNSEKLITKVFA